jgi:phosphatidylinositol alpha-mannosyltransferase
MRVGLVCPYSFDSPGGVQNHVLGLAAYLRRHGHEPSILAPGELDDTDPLQAELRSSFTSAGSAIPVPYNGSVARVNFGPRSAARVRRWLRAGEFDLVHIHEPITPSVAILALWACEVPVVATFHTATPRSRTMQVAGGTMQSTVEKIDAGIAVSESARRVVVQHLGRDAVVVPNGFSHADFASVADLPGTSSTRSRWRGGEQPRLTFLGRVDEPRKGLDVLLAALPTIRAQVPELDVVVAGQGSRRLPPGCSMPGAISNDERAALLAGTDVFVAPHLARESFGIVLLEAMAGGAAVVASDLPAFVDILSAGTAGTAGPSDRAGRDALLGSIFPAGDSEALASSVAEVLLRPDPTRTEGARSASRRYDWAVVGNEIVEVYRAAVSAGSPSVPGRLRPVTSRQGAG